MTTGILNKVAYLRNSRNFPEESQPLSVEVSKSYIDIANAVNTRVIGLFSVNFATISGEQWFITKNAKQQSLRQVYAFSGTAPIPHGLNFDDLTQFTRAYGTFTDGTNWYGAIFGSNVAIAGQISFYITPMNIVILSGAGAPTVTRGTIVLEWLSNV